MSGISRSSTSAPVAPAGLIVVAAAMLGLAAGAAAGGVSLSPLSWYLARASGLSLYLLLWLSVVSGLAMTTRMPRVLAGGGQSWLMHRVTSELSIVMLALHILSVELLLVVLPFTKLFHAFTLFGSRWYNGKVNAHKGVPV